MAKREKPEQKLSFEEGFLQLEQIVASLEQGKLPLQDSFEAYERGVEMLKQLERQLGESEAKIQLLTAGGTEKPLAQDTQEGG